MSYKEPTREECIINNNLPRGYICIYNNNSYQIVNVTTAKKILRIIDSEITKKSTHNIDHRGRMGPPLESSSAPT